MIFKEISLDLIDDNPYQPRKEYDPKIMTSIATSSMDNIGIRNPPLVRPHPKNEGRFQIASGHGRTSAWKALGNETIMCRIEKLTESQMKKEVLVENVNRSDLMEDERFQALEVYRLDPDTDDPKINEMLLEKKVGWISDLSRITGINRHTLSDIYDVQEIRQAIKHEDVLMSEKPTVGMIKATSGLETEDRVSLIVKAIDMEWSRSATFKVKTAIKALSADAKKYLIDDKRTRTPYTVVVSLSQLPEEQQMETIKYIKQRGLNEEHSLRLIERVTAGEPPQEVVFVDKYQRVIDSFIDVYRRISSFGYNHMMIMGHRWKECLEILDDVEEKIKEIRSLERRIVDPG